MKDHLLDGRIYQRLSKADCANNKKCIEEELKTWMKTFNKTLTKMERAFLKQGLDNNKKAFAGFYLTLKAHKLKPGQNVTHLKSRPIAACPGSLLHPLGIWIDRKLQVIARQQESYFRTVSNYVNNYVPPHIQQMPNSSLRMQYQCIQISLRTQPSC